MKKHKALAGLLIIGSLLQLGGCAWAYRNKYQEPSSPDTGSIVIINRALPFNTVVVLFNERGENGKYAAMFEAKYEQTVKALHSNKIVLTMQLVLSGPTALGYASESCQKTYAVPFSSGDLLVDLSVHSDGSEKKQCAYKFYRRDASEKWRLLNDVEEWKGPLKMSA